MNEVIDGKKYSQALRDKVKNFVEIIKEKKIMPMLSLSNL